MYSLVDFRGFVLRSYHSGTDSEPLKSKEGKDVNTWYHAYDNFFENFLVQFLELTAADKTIFVTEGGNQLRKDLFADYKKGRGADACEVEREQIQVAEREISTTLKKMGFFFCRQEGLEADDVIAYLSQELDGGKLVHTVDQDLTVLSNSNATTVTYYPPKKDPVIVDDTYEDIPTRFMSLKKSIVGDKSDCYGGVSGLGPKKFDEFFEEFGEEGLEELLSYAETSNFDELNQDADELQNKFLLTIWEQREDWALYYSVAKLYPHLCNSVIGRKMHKIEWLKQLPCKETYARVIEEFEGNDDLSQILEGISPEFILVTLENYAQEFKRYSDLLRVSPLAAWDYETYDSQNHAGIAEVSKNGVDVLAQVPTGVSVAVGPFCSKVFYFSCFHADTDNISRGQMIEVISALMESRKPKGRDLAVQSMQFESVVTKVNYPDIKLADQLDTALYQRKLFENDSSSLKPMSLQHMNYVQATYKETVGDKAGMHELTGAETLDYGCDDSLVTAHLLYLFRILSEIEGSRSFIETYTNPAASILSDAFIEGDEVSLDRLEELREQDAGVVETSMARVREILKEHCSLPNEEAAEALLKADIAYHKAKAEEKGVSRADFKQVRESKLNDLIVSSIYVDYSEIEKDVEFTPTAKQLNSVMKKLLPEAPELKSVSNRAILELSIACEGIKELQNFIILLNNASGGELKAREGVYYDNLVSYCGAVLDLKGKVEKVGSELNMNSPNQVQAVLYCMLGLPVRIRTKKQPDSFRETHDVPGAPATNDIAMATALAEDCWGENEWKGEVLRLISEVNSAQTREKFYWKSYPLWASRDGRVHPQFIPSATTTNRPTGNSPNMLQLSKGDVRSIFEAPEGWSYVCIDMASQELRLLADATQDPVMMSAYLGDNKKDLHALAATGSALEIMRRTRPDVDTSEWVSEKGVLDYDFFIGVLKDNDSPLLETFAKLRGYGKTGNFSLVFGSTAATLSQQLMIPLDLAEVIMEGLYSAYARLQPWKDETIKLAKKQGYVQTPFGTRRHCWPEIIAKDGYTKSSMERKVCNFMAQGAAAEILEVLLTNAKNGGAFVKGRSKLVAPIYDEVVSLVRDDFIVDYWRKMQKAMSITPPGCSIPQIPELSIGIDSWGTVVELGPEPTLKQIQDVLNGN